MEFSHPEFPNSIREPFSVTSPATRKYNCIAWSLEINDRWYWPGDDISQYWPDDIPREASVDAFIKLYESHGYEVCDDGSYEEDFVKIALFTNYLGNPEHASRQLNENEWTSKLGSHIDVSHTLEAIEGGKYGNVELFMKKKISAFKRRLLSVK